MFTQQMGSAGSDFTHIHGTRPLGLAFTSQVLYIRAYNHSHGRKIFQTTGANILSSPKITSDGWRNRGEE
jgi:hypothetical protein